METDHYIMCAFALDDYLKHVAKAMIISLTFKISCCNNNGIKNVPLKNDITSHITLAPTLISLYQINHQQ